MTKNQWQNEETVSKIVKNKKKTQTGTPKNLWKEKIEMKKGKS